MATHKSEIGTWRTRIPNVYGTNPPNTADMRRILSSDQNVFDIDTATADDSGYDNGSDMAQDVWALTNDTGVTIPSDFNWQDIGTDLYACLGGYAVTEISTGIYQHTFTPQNPSVSRQLPPYAYFKKYGSLKILVIWDGVMTSFSISGGVTGRLTTSKTIKGSGDYDENPSGYTMPALEDDREFGYAQQARFWLDKASAGTKQVETATVVGTITEPGAISVVITSALLSGGSKTLGVTVADNDTAAQVAGKIRDALGVDADIVRNFTVSGASTAVILTAKVKAANDATLNIATSTGSATGLTPSPTSVSTTGGVAGSTLNPACSINSWTLTFNNPAADEGFNVCSPYLVANDPDSGAVRTEYLFGARDYTLTYDVRLGANDPQRTWFRERTDLNLTIPIQGELIASSGYFYSLTIEHTKARMMSPKENIGRGDMIGVSGTAKLMSDAGSIPLSIVLVNDIPSYAS